MSWILRNVEFQPEPKRLIVYGESWWYNSVRKKVWVRNMKIILGVFKGVDNTLLCLFSTVKICNFLFAVPCLFPDYHEIAYDLVDR